MGTSLDFLQPLSRINYLVVSYYQPSPPPLLDMCWLSKQHPLHGASGSIGEGKKTNAHHFHHQCQQPIGSGFLKYEP